MTPVINQSHAKRVRLRYLNLKIERLEQQRKSVSLDIRKYKKERYGLQKKIDKANEPCL